MDTIKLPDTGGRRKRNPYAEAVRTNKCFTPKIVSVKVKYSRKMKHKGKESTNGY